MDGNGMTAMVKLACTTLTLLLMPFLYPTGFKEEVGQLEPSLEELVVESYPRMIDSYFIQNLGQMDSDEILFYSGGGNVFFTPKGVTFRFREMEPIYDDAFENDLSSSDKFRRPPDRYRERGVVINYTFVGANPVIPRGRERCSWNTNYFKGNDPDRWFPHVPNYKEVVYENIWDGIDIVYMITEDGVKYDIIIHPGSDPTKIGFELSGQERLMVNNNRELVIGTRYWNILDSGLVAYYSNEEDNLIDCGFQIKNEKIIGYEVEPYDTTRQVEIDPLIYSTLIGGEDIDSGYGIAQDRNGNITITGSTKNAIIDFPTTTGAYDIIQNGRSVAFITKFKSDLSSLIYSTFLEGSSKEENSFGYDITMDANDYPYITGSIGNTGCSCTFPTTKGAYSETYNGRGDIFMTKLNQNGSVLVYSTLIGGSGDDYPSSIFLDPTSNNVYITGYTEYYPDAYPIIDYPTTEGAYDRSLNGDGDVFISVIDSLGMRLLYSTLIGGSNSDYVNDIILDVENDSVIITGYTQSSDYPTTNGSYDRTFGGSVEAFVSKFNLNLSTLLHSTFVGGNKVDHAYGIDLDNDGNIHITGCTGGDFPVTENAHDTSPNGYFDVFVTKFDPTMSSIIYSTYIGGNQDDYASDIIVNEKGCAIITGATKEASVLYPTTKGTFDREIRSWDVLITLLNENGSSLEYSTYIGEIQEDRGAEISLDHDRNVTIIGNTGCRKNGFPTSENAYRRVSNGNNDVFVLKMYLVDDSTPPCFGHDNSDTEATTGDPFTFNVSISDDERRVTNANVLFRYGNFSYTNVSLEGNGSYTYTTYVPIFSLLPITYYFYATDYALNVNITVPRTVEVRDNDCPVFYRDLSWKSGTTGEPVTFEVDVRDNIGVSSVQVEYWGEGDHLIANMSETGPDRYSVTVNVPLDTMKMNYVFHAVDTSGNRNSTGKRSFDIKDNDGPYFGPDLTSNVGYTGNVFSFISDSRDNIGVSEASVEYWFGKGYRYNESMKGSGPYVFNITVPDDSLDPLFYRYSVVDVNGYWNNTGVKEVRIEDDDPPVFGVETFLDLVTTGDVMEVRMVVKDNIGVEGVYLEHWFGTGERANVSMYGKGPYTCNVQVPTTTKGPLNYAFHAVDWAGNWGETPVRKRTVHDNDGPVFGKDDTDKVCTTGEPFTFRTSVSDNMGVKEVFAEYWFGTGRHTNLSMTGTGRYECVITIPPSPSLTLQYKFSAVDEEGNWAETREMKVTVLDNDAPEIGTDQTPSAVNTGELFQFKVTASDNIGIVEAMIIYRFDEGKETSAKMSGSGYYMAIRTFTYDLSVPLNGLEPIHYRIVLTDQAGNSVECDGTVMVKDSIGPVADAGADIVVKQGTTVVLNGSMSTDNIVITNWTWRWEEGSEEVVLEGISVIYRFKRAGTYIVTLTVKDGSGNVGTDTMTVVVEKTDGKDRSYQFFSLLVILPLLSLIITLPLIIKRKRKQSIGKEMRTEMAEQKPL